MASDGFQWLLTCGLSARMQLGTNLDEESKMAFKAPEPVLHAPVHALAATTNEDVASSAAGPEVKQLMDMGFSRDQASSALEATNNDVNAAIATLLNLDGAAADTPPSPGVAAGAAAGAAAAEESSFLRLSTRQGSFRRVAKPTTLPPKVQPPPRPELPRSPTTSHYLQRRPTIP